MLIAHAVLAPTQQLVFIFHLQGILLVEAISSGDKIKHLPTINNMKIFNHQKDRNYNDGMYIHMEYIQTFKIKVLKIF